MEDGILYSYSLNVSYACPECGLRHTLWNRDIPTENPVKHICEECKTVYRVLPIEIKINPKNILFGKTYVSAKKIIVGYGYSRTEADDLLVKAIEDSKESISNNISTVDLAKLALSKVKPKE